MTTTPWCSSGSADTQWHAAGINYCGCPQRVNEFQNAHNAEADVDACTKCYQKLIGLK